MSLLVGSSYLSQNWFFKSENLVFYLTFWALQDGYGFIQIGEFRLSTDIGNRAWLSCSDSYVYKYIREQIEKFILQHILFATRDIVLFISYPDS